MTVVKLIDLRCGVRACPVVPGLVLAGVSRQPRAANARLAPWQGRICRVQVVGAGAVRQAGYLLCAGRVVAGC